MLTVFGQPDAREGLLVAANYARRLGFAALEEGSDGASERTAHLLASIDAFGRQFLDLPDEAEVAEIASLLVHGAVHIDGLLRRCLLELQGMHCTSGIVRRTAALIVLAEGGRRYSNSLSRRQCSDGGTHRKKRDRHR